MCRGSDDQWVALTRTLELWVWESRAKPELCILALGRKLRPTVRPPHRPTLLHSAMWPLTGFTGTPGLPGTSRPFETCQNRMQGPLWIWRNSMLD